MTQATHPPSIPMMDVYLPMMRASAMVTAGELGMFHALHAHGPLDAAALAQRLACSTAGVDALCQALWQAGMLTCRGGHYANAPFVTEHFTPAAQSDFTPGLKWTAEAWKIMSNLTDAVRRGGPVKTMWQQMSEQPAMGALFSDYMNAFARMFAPLVQQHVELPAGSRRLLDVGGSHGLHAVAFCRRYPDLRATLFDLPDSLHSAPRVLRDAGMEDRVDLKAGNLLTDELGSGYDTVLLLSVLHNQTPQDSPGILRRVARALRPGGMLVVHEHFQGADGPLPFPSAFLLTLLVEVGTTLVDRGLLEGWVRDAGLRVERRVEFAQDGMGSLVICTRPADGT